MNQEQVYTLLFALLSIIAPLIYLARIFARGRPRFDRVDSQGESYFLGKRAMEMGYWFMQPIARLLIYLGMTANQITWLSLVFGLLAGACLAFGHFGFGAGFALVAGAMDMLDGLVARLTGCSSEGGEILDSVMDRNVEFLFLGGLALYYREIPVLLALSLLALFGSFMVSYSSLAARAERITIPRSKWSMRRPERVLYLILGAALSPITIPWLEKVQEFPVPLAHPMIVSICLVAVFANYSAIEQTWYTIRGIREREIAEAKTAARAQSQDKGTPEDCDQPVSWTP